MDAFTPRAIWSKQKQKAGVLPFIPPPNAPVFQTSIHSARAHYATLTKGSLPKPARPHPFDFMPRQRKRRNVSPTNKDDGRDPTDKMTQVSPAETSSTSSSTEPDTSLPLALPLSNPLPLRSSSHAEGDDNPRESEVRVRMRTEDDAVSVSQAARWAMDMEDAPSVCAPSESLQGVDKWLAIGRDEDEDDDDDDAAPNGMCKVLLCLFSLVKD